MDINYATKTKRCELLKIIRNMIPQEIITEETSFDEDLYYDDYDILKLICELENFYEVYFSDEQIMKLKNIGDLLDILSEEIDKI